MPRRLPKTLIVFLVLLSAGSFALSLHLERNRLDWLQAHPIMVNLLSGVVGFATATLVVAVGLSWLFERYRLRDKSSDLYDAMCAFVLGLVRLARMLPREVFPDDPREAERLIRDAMRHRGVKAQELADEPALESRDMVMLVPYRSKHGVISRMMHSERPGFSFTRPDDKWFRESVLGWLDAVGRLVEVFGLDDTDDVTAPAHRLRSMMTSGEFGNAYNVGSAFGLIQEIADGVYGHRTVKRYLKMYPHMRDLEESKGGIIYPVPYRAGHSGPR